MLLNSGRPILTTSDAEDAEKDGACPVLNVGLGSLVVFLVLGIDKQAYPFSLRQWQQNPIKPRLSDCSSAL